MTRRRYRINRAWSKLERLTGVEPYVPQPDPKLDAARRAYMNTPEWWHECWREDKERA